MSERLQFSLYIAVLKTDDQVQFYISVEKQIIGFSKSVFSALTNLISAYYVFNIAYPKPINALLIFVQHFVLLLKDKQHVPASVTQLISVLDKLNI